MLLNKFQIFFYHMATLTSSPLLFGIHLRNNRILLLTLLLLLLSRAKSSHSWLSVSCKYCCILAGVLSSCRVHVVCLSAYQPNNVEYLCVCMSRNSEKNVLNKHFNKGYEKLNVKIYTFIYKQRKQQDGWKYIYRNVYHWRRVAKKTIQFNLCLRRTKTHR